jgi:ribosomal protein S18 acetylase RimI-like enzyme
VTVQIREALPSEYEQAGRVTMRAYAEFFAPEGHDEDQEYLWSVGQVEARAARTTVLVALLEGAIVGCVTLELDGRADAGDEPLEPGRAHIRMLGVAPWARGRGVGRALMTECELRAREAGKTFVTLHTTHLMTAARSMYETLGFERIGDHVLPDGFVLLGYRKDLQPSTN